MAVYTKYACPNCRDGVLTAPGPQRILERSIADASVLAHVVVSKYVDHTPLHRLHESYARTGASIPVSTLSDWTGGVADLLAPLVERLERRVLSAHVVRTDATGLKVLDPRTPANIQRGTIWVYLGDEHDVVFRYAETGDGASGPWEFLGGRDGPIQAAGASVFDRLFNGQVASALEVGCLAHYPERDIIWSLCAPGANTAAEVQGRLRITAPCLQGRQEGDHVGSRLPPLPSPRRAARDRIDARRTAAPRVSSAHW
jgi:hypothetical protein